MIISHAHVDHVGGLVYSDNFQFSGKILMSKVTRAITLMNINQYQQKIEKNSQNGNKQKLQFTEIQYFQPYKLNNYSDATVTLYPVPHIPGSSFILIQSNKRKILYTGDFNFLYPQFIQQNFIFYPELQNIDVLITETTFSSTIFQDYQTMQLNQYTNSILNILSKNQTILTASAQDVLNYTQMICHICDRLKLQNFIISSKKPYNVVEGVSKKYQQAIVLSSESNDISGQRGIFHRDFFNAKMNGDSQLLVTTPKQINIHSSLDNLFQHCSDKNALFLLTGAVQPGSYNWRLINNSVKSIKRDNQREYTNVYAEFEQLGQVGHADFPSLYRLIKQTQAKVVVGTHCAQIENLKNFEKMGEILDCRICSLVGMIALKLWKEDKMEYMDKQQQTKLYRVKTGLSKQTIQEKLELQGIPINQNIQITDDGILIICCQELEIKYLCQQLGLQV